MAPIRLFLHIGPAKTGTSAIQRILAGHDGSLLLYPRIGLWPDGSHHNLVFNFFADYRRPETVRQDPAAMLAAIGAQARATGRPVLISSEALGPARVAPFLAALTKAIGCGAEQTRILVVCREHFARAASLYGQRVKDAQHLERRAPGAFLRQEAPALRYGPLLDALCASGFPLAVLNYHPAADFVPRFLREIGFPPDRLPANERRNVSLGVRGMIALLAANHVAKDAATRRRLAQQMAGLKHRFASPGFVFDRASATAVAPLFAQDAEQVRQRWQVDLPRLDAARSVDGFFLDDGDLRELQRVCAPMGREGEAILGHASAYRRHQG